MRGRNGFEEGGLGAAGRVVVAVAVVGFGEGDGGRRFVGGGGRGAGAREEEEVAVDIPLEGNPLVPDEAVVAVEDGDANPATPKAPPPELVGPGLNGLPLNGLDETAL